MGTWQRFALNRFGLGAAPGEAETIGGDPRGWVATQIDRRAAPGTAGGRASDSVLAEMHRAAIEGPEQLRATARRLYSSVFGPEIVTRARHAIETEQPFAERMALLWSNHFTVSRTRAIVGPAIPAYEREAIRPYVFGRFADMLKAVCRHPCMLEYLDNIVSIGPAVGGRPTAARARRRGANPQREPRPRNPRAAHPRRERRLWPTGRDRTRQGDQRLESRGLSPTPGPASGGGRLRVQAGVP